MYYADEISVEIAERLLDRLEKVETKEDDTNGRIYNRTFSGDTINTNK